MTFDPTDRRSNFLLRTKHPHMHMAVAEFARRGLVLFDGHAWHVRNPLAQSLATVSTEARALLRAELCEVDGVRLRLNAHGYACLTAAQTVLGIDAAKEADTRLANWSTMLAAAESDGLRERVIASRGREFVEFVEGTQWTAAAYDPTDPATYCDGARYEATHDAAEQAPSVDPVAAILELVGEFRAKVAATVTAGAMDAPETAQQFERNASDLLDRIRITLHDAFDTRRHREEYTHMVAGRRLVACVHKVSVFEHCPNGCDN